MTRAAWLVEVARLNRITPLAATDLRPLIEAVRIDERAKAHVHATGTSTGDGPCCECCYATTQGADAIAEERAEYAKRAGIFTSGYEEGYLDALDIAEQIARRGTR